MDAMCDRYRTGSRAEGRVHDPGQEDRSACKIMAVAFGG